MHLVKIVTFVGKNVNYQGTCDDPMAIACANGHLHVGSGIIFFIIDNNLLQVLNHLLAKCKTYAEVYQYFGKKDRLLFEIAAMYNRAEVLKTLIDLSIVSTQVRTNRTYCIISLYY